MRPKRDRQTDRDEHWSDHDSERLVAATSVLAEATSRAGHTRFPKRPTLISYNSARETGIRLPRQTQLYSFLAPEDLIRTYRIHDLHHR